MMAQFPCLPLWTDAWLADTYHLNRDAPSRVKRDAYLHLLIQMWRSPGCRVPDDNGWLGEHMQMTKDEVRDILRPVIAEFCRIEGQFVVQPRLLKEFQRTHQQKERLTKWRKRRKNKEPTPST